MRTISASAAAARAARAQADFVRVQVKDAGGTWRDLTTYGGGVNPVLNVSWSEAVSDPHRSADVSLMRELFRISYSPWIAASPINKAFDPAATNVLLQLGREFKVDAAVMPMDRQPGAGDWLTVFHGRIDSIDPGGGGLKFGGRDLAGRIADQQIKREYVYSFASDGGAAVPLRPWTAGMVVALNEYVLPASRGDDDPGLGKFYKCTTAGTAGNSEPVWPAASTVADGSVVWTFVGATSSVGRPVEQVIQNILDTSKSAGDATTTLHVPSSPGWAIKEFLQARDHTLPAVKALALQIGWDVRSKWRAATSQFELTLFEPERSKTVADCTFLAGEYLPLKRFETNIDRIRNSWTIKYSDTADLWPDGSAKRKEINVSDSSSITKYGELWAEIQEGSASNIDTSTEATAMITAALADCKEPTAEQEVELAGGFPWAEIGDLDEFAADGLTFDTAQKMAIAKFSQSFSEGKLRTTLALSGKPSLGAERWIQGTTDQPILAIIAVALGNGQAKSSGATAFTGPKTARPQAIEVPGGTDIRIIDSTQDKQREAMEYEVHTELGTDLDFTPTDDTLQTVMKGGRVSLGGFAGGSELVVKAVPRMYSRGRLVRGQPSKGVQAAAGRVKSGLLDRLATSGGVLNGDFKHIFDEDPENSVTPPEHWRLTAGDFGPGEDARNLLVTTYGMIVSLEQTGTNAIVQSDVWRTRLGANKVLLAMRVRPQGTMSAGRNLQVQVQFWEDADGASSLGDHDTAVPSTFLASGTWGIYTETIDVPAGASYMSVRFHKEAVSSAYGWEVANIELTESGGVTQEARTAVSFAANWANADAAYSDASFFKASDGLVHIHGTVKFTSTPLTTTIFTLPAGYRPAKNQIFATRCSTGVISNIQIFSATGLVVFGGVLADSTGSVQLDGIHFDTR